MSRKLSPLSAPSPSYGAFRYACSHYILQKFLIIYRLLSIPGVLMHRGEDFPCDGEKLENFLSVSILLSVLCCLKSLFLHFSYKNR